VCVNVVHVTADPTATDEDVRDLGPVIDDSEDDEEQRTSFQLPVYDSRDRRQLHPLVARVGMDASSVFGFMSPKVTTARRIGAMQDFLTRALVDDDGISVHETVRAVVKRDDDWVDVAQADPPAKGSEVRYVVGDHTDWESEEAAEEHARDHGSSLRRWASIMDDPMLRIKQSALQGIVNHVVGEGGDRPTKPSKGSSGSRKTPARSARS
jgi:hypothetical protein